MEKILEIPENLKKSRVSIRDLKVSFVLPNGLANALDEVSLDIYEGETLGLVGETGCGKSLTSRAIMGLIPQPPGIIEGGSILLDGEELLSRDEEYMQKVRGNKVSMVFQEPGISLNPVLTVGLQISEVFMLHRLNDLIRARIEKLERKQVNIGSISLRALRMTLRNPRHPIIRLLAIIPGINNFRRHLESEAKAKAIEALKMVRIPDPEDVMKKYPHQLSGGMLQRVLLATALSCRPRVLIADEPTSSLDVSVGAQILKLLDDLRDEVGSSILLVTHDLGIVAWHCDRVAVMYAGRIVEVGSVKDVFQNPLHPYTKGLFGCMISTNLNRGEAKTIDGVVPNLLHPPGGCRFHPRCPDKSELCDKEWGKLKEFEPDHYVSCHLFK